MFYLKFLVWFNLLMIFFKPLHVLKTFYTISQLFLNGYCTTVDHQSFVNIQACCQPLSGLSSCCFTSAELSQAFCLLSSLSSSTVQTNLQAQLAYQFFPTFCLWNECQQKTFTLYSQKCTLLNMKVTRVKKTGQQTRQAGSLCRVIILFV